MSQTDSIKLNIAIGIITIYSIMIAIVSYFFNTSGFQEYIGYLMLGCFGINVILFVLYIITVAAKYKRTKKRYIDDWYISDNVSNSLYDTGVDLFMFGILNIIYYILLKVFSWCLGDWWNMVPASIILLTLILLSNLLFMKRK